MPVWYATAFEAVHNCAVFMGYVVLGLLFLLLPLGTLYTHFYPEVTAGAPSAHFYTLEECHQYAIPRH